jgi:hypothetical protein
MNGKIIRDLDRFQLEVRRLAIRVVSSGLRHVQEGVLTKSRIHYSNIRPKMENIHKYGSSL